MKLRFEVDQADSFRRGIDRPKSIVSIDVNPADIPEDQRTLLANHLDGIDVLEFFHHHGEVIKGYRLKELSYTSREPKRIVAKAATLDALIAATKANHDFIGRIQESFNQPVQFQLIQKPPTNESEFEFISIQRSDFLSAVSEAIRQMRRVSFECLIDEVQKELNKGLNASSYTVYLLPITNSTARARFYCEPVFVAQFMGKQVLAHTPIIVYNEKTGRIVESKNLFNALDVYMLNPSANLNDLSILSWENGRWIIIAPEGIIHIANESLWIKTDWNYHDLHHKRVEFEIPVEGGTATGIGEFWVRQNADGLFAIDIVTDTQGRSWAERIQTRFHLPQAAEKRIARHPDPKVADFLVK